MAKCLWHLCDKEAKIKFCSKNCCLKLYVHRRRKKLKQLAVAHLGGKCTICGYNKCVDALDFHHLDPKEKSFAISYKGYTRSWENVKLELAKCILLCANCHRELEAGLIKIDSPVR
jgi:hypothetical protein